MRQYIELIIGLLTLSVLVFTLVLVVQQIPSEHETLMLVKQIQGRQ